MAETAEVPAAAPVAKKSKTTAKPKKSKTAPSHPKVSDMVNSAIGSLKERGGSSLQAIKKHIAANHKVDVEKLSPFIKKYLKSAVASGNLVQTKGKGATGSFRMNATTGKVKPAKKPAAAKAVKKPKTVAAKKPKQAKKAVKPKASKITKKAKVVKPKTPKPKKAKTPVKKAAPKKGAKK